MNEFLDPSFVEIIHRLALGLEPIDAARGGRVPHPVRVFFEEELRRLPRPPVERHDSCLHALRYQAGVEGRVRLRFQEEHRRYVPRLISYPILTLPQADALPYPNRVRRPRLFPGAAYDLAFPGTGMRGRAVRNDRPLRWVRVVARLTGNGSVVGRAQGDDRGEFLLLIEPAASPVGDLVNPLTLRVEVSAPAVLPAPASPDLPALDPFWDLPLEEAQALNPADPEVDPVSAGETLPQDYTATVARNVDFTLGRIHSEVTPFLIP
jgi:hypothetical protein